MKWGRFLLGVATGAAFSYLVYKEIQDQPLQPEKVIQQLKERYQANIPIIGTWIHTEPRLEEMDGVRYKVYQCGLTGVVEDEPRFFEFKVDADTGTVLSVENE